MAGEPTTYRGDRVGILLERLRPHPHRGDVVAAGTVVLTTFAFVLETRFDSAWAAGVRLLIFALALGLVGTMAVLAPIEGETPRAYQAVLYVASFLLAVLTLATLADALGAGDGGGDFPAGTFVWAGLLLIGFAGFFAARRNSAIMTLLGALTGVVVLLSFVDWVSSISGVQTVRWLLALSAVALGVGALWWRDLRRRHAVALVDAAGVAVAVLGMTVAIEGALGAVFGAFDGEIGYHGGPAGWELVLLACGFGLLAYGSVDRERVVAFLGVVNLSLFVLVAGPRSGAASLIGWPILLLAIAGVLLAVGLRPREDLPAEPAPPRPPPPVTPVTPVPTAVAEPAEPDETSPTEPVDTSASQRADTSASEPADTSATERPDP